METLLVLTPDLDSALPMRRLLENNYSIESAFSVEDAYTILGAKDVCAVLEEFDFATIHNYNFVKCITNNNLYASLPIIVYSKNQNNICYADACLQAGFSDFILPPLTESLIQKRIHNAVRSKESFTFSDIENILRELPSNIYLKDAEGKYIFATHYWSHINGRGAKHWTIRGKTDLEIRKDKANARKAMETDRAILSSGQGTTYVIEENTDGEREFLELIKRPTHDRDGKVNGIVALINNVTEKQLLKMELERRATVDSLTGLLNKKATEELIAITLKKNDRSGHVERGALLMIDVDNFKDINDTFGHRTGDKVLMGIAGIIHSSFKGRDVKGRVGGDEFMVYACGVSDVASVHRLAASIVQQAAQIYEGSSLDGYVSLSVGIALYPQNGATFSELYASADSALYTVKNKGKGAYSIAS
ncbi:MAG: diguanylate cyclase [Desulfovibrio sp.]|nr:diguanylate cyclase [Desulfovibrio sp.]